MAQPGQQINLLTQDLIVRINQTLINRTIGTFIPPKNLLHKEPLEWVLGRIQHPLSFGENPYPTLFDKAALLAWTIITRHVFYDGNKRAGMGSLQVFLLINDYFLLVSNEELEEMALRIVENKDKHFTLAQFRDWIEENCEEIDSDHLE